MTTKKCFFIGKEKIDSQIYSEVVNKFTHQAIATICTASEEHTEQALQLAQYASAPLRILPRHIKSSVLKHISNELLRRKQEFAEMIAQEAGKPLKYARIEVERASQTFSVASEEVNRFYGELMPVDIVQGGEQKEAVIRYVPIGIVFGITPFNFPLNLVAHKIAPAIAAGCPIILKPSSLTPLSAIALGEIIAETQLPEGSVTILPMHRNVADKLLTDNRIKKLSFTGSPEVGWKMKANCEKKRITLELGGNAAVIVTPTADVIEAVQKCVTGAFAYSGQVCIHTQRIYVHEGIFETFVSNFTQKASLLQYGNPSDSDTDISIMIEEKEAIRVEQWIKEAIEQGAVLLDGGNREGAYIHPTVLTNTNPEMKVWKDEVFGPVVIIEKYSSFDEAIGFANNSRFGLQTSVFTNNINEMNTAFDKIESGAVLINESPTFRADHLAYGGVKESGFGREGVRFAMLEMSEIKVLIKPV